jgi:hypothetical protein
MDRPILTPHDGGADNYEDEQMWRKLAAAAGECFDLDLSCDAYDALQRIESATRRAAGLPPQTRRRLRSA